MDGTNRVDPDWISSEGAETYKNTQPDTYTGLADRSNPTSSTKENGISNRKTKHPSAIDNNTSTEKTEKINKSIERGVNIYRSTHKKGLSKRNKAHR